MKRTPFSLTFCSLLGIATFAIWLSTLALLWAASSQGAVLQGTLPSTLAALDYNPETDTWSPGCGTGNEPLTDLATHRLWWWPIGGGELPRVIREHDVRGMEGVVDTFVVDEAVTPGHYYTTVTRAGGRESCPSNTAYVGPITSVDVSVGASDSVVSRRLFDVRGRVAHGRAGGVYFEATEWASGRRTVRKVVVW